MTDAATATDYAALVERLRADAKDFIDWNGKLMTSWDKWRSYIAEGRKGSWPRDGFESWAYAASENFTEAADAIEALLSERDEARALTEPTP